MTHHNSSTTQTTPTSQRRATIYAVLYRSTVAVGFVAYCLAVWIGFIHPLIHPLLSPPRDATSTWGGEPLTALFITATLFALLLLPLALWLYRQTVYARLAVASGRSIREVRLLVAQAKQDELAARQELAVQAERDKYHYLFDDTIN